MAKAGRVIRGADWAVALRTVLAVAPGDTVAWMAQHTRVLKSDTYSRAGLFELQQQPCFLKLYLAKSPLQGLGFRLGYGRPFRSFDAARQMRDCGLPAPKPKACVAVPEGVLLLTEAIADSRDLRALWQAQPGLNQASHLMCCAGEALAALHRAGFAHGDCKWSNLLWNGERFYLVDLDAVRKVAAREAAAGPAQRRQVRDLARFTVDAERHGVSPEHYELFLQAYCVASNHTRAQLASALASAAATIRRRHAKKYGVESAALV